MGREREADIIDVLRWTFNRWKDDPWNYLLPSLEYFVDLMVVMMIVLCLTVPFSLYLEFSGLFHTESGNPTLTFFILNYGFQFLLSIGMLFIRGMLNGGGIMTISKLKAGEEYNFFDLLKAGWKKKWTFLKIEATLYLLMMGIFLVVLVPFVIIMVIMIVAIESNSIGIGILLLFLIMALLMLVVAILLIPVSMLYYPLFFLTYAFNNEYGTGGRKSVRRSLKWMNANRKQAMLFGLLFFAGSMLMSAIPFAGLIFVGVLQLFSMDIASQIIPNEHRQRFISSSKRSSSPLSSGLS